MDGMTPKSRSSRGFSRESMANAALTKKMSGPETPVNGSETPELVDEISGGKSSKRFSTMKKAAEEQRKKVRETRNRLQEEEKLIVQHRKQEELKVQIRTTLESVMDETKKEMLLILQEKIDQEKHIIRRDLKADLESSEDILTVELERRFANGEAFDSVTARLQKEAEENFYRIAKTELAMVQRDMIVEIERKVEQDEKKWQEQFSRNTNEKIRETEDHVLKNFRCGVEDAQRHCDNILNSVQDRVKVLDGSFKQKMDAMSSTNSAKLSETCNIMKKFVDDLLTERASNLISSIQAQNERLRQEISQVRREVGHVRSRACAIL